MKKTQIITLAALIVAFILVPSVQAKIPVSNMKNTQPIPDSLVAGNTYDIIFTFDNTAREEVPLYVDIAVTCEEAALNLGEIKIDSITLNDLPIACTEDTPGHFTTPDPGNLAARTRYTLKITVSTLINLMPGTYNFEIDLIGESVQTQTQTTSPSPNTKPVADAGANKKTLVDRRVYFDGSGSYDPDGSLSSYTWSFGDDKTATGVKTQHTYTEPGEYTVKLTVQDNRGSTDSDTCTIIVTEPPAPVIKEVNTEIDANATNYLVDALTETNTTVTVNTSKPVTVSIIKYDTNPYPDDPMPNQSLPIYLDIEISNLTAVKFPIYVEVHYSNSMVQGKKEESFGLYYWKNSAWYRCGDTGVDTARKIVWAYMTEYEASGSPVLIGYTALTPAAFTTSNITVNPQVITQGEKVTLSVTITNTGEEAGIYGYSVTIGGKLVTLEGTLNGGASEVRSFDVYPEWVGTETVSVNGLSCSYTVNPELNPAEFVFSNLQVSPITVTEGETVTVTVEVKNTGDLAGKYTVILLLDGLVYETREKTLAADTLVIEDFIPIEEEPGTHTVQVEDMSVTFTVNEKPQTEINPLYLIGAGILVAIIGIVLYRYKKKEP